MDAGRLREHVFAYHGFVGRYADAGEGLHELADAVKRFLGHVGLYPGMKSFKTAMALARGALPALSPIPLMVR